MVPTEYVLVHVLFTENTRNFSLRIFILNVINLNHEQTLQLPSNFTHISNEADVKVPVSVAMVMVGNKPPFKPGGFCRRDHSTLTHLQGDCRLTDGLVQRSCLLREGRCWAQRRGAEPPGARAGDPGGSRARTCVCSPLMLKWPQQTRGQAQMC